MVDREYLRTQSELVKLLVHDLRNPISALSANMSYVESAIGDDDDDLREAIVDSMAAIEMLLRMSQNVEMVSKLEAKERFEAQEMALDGIVLSSVRRNASLAASAGMSVRSDEPIPNLVGRWPKMLMQLVIDNLIVSAIRHCSAGAEVAVSAVVEGSHLHLTVQDPGYPLPADLTDALLTREGQLEARRRPDARYARGWGLYAVGLAAQELGGRIEIESTEGRTAFTLIVPV